MLIVILFDASSGIDCALWFVVALALFGVYYCVSFDRVITTSLDGILSFKGDGYVRWNSAGS